MIALAYGDWRAELAPVTGGAILSLTHCGRPVLRPSPEGATDPLATACFPLIPYANRIAQGRFAFEEQVVDLGVTPGFAPHALHGVGWRRPWRVTAQTPTSARLALDHAPDGDWPWRFAAEQAFSLTDAGLTVNLTLTNVDTRPFPAGLGLHPYLHRPLDARLTVRAPRVWLTDDVLIPREAAPAAALIDWADGPPVADAPFVDNAYDGWDGAARLDSREGAVLLNAPGVSRVHVYAPQGADFVCVEPVSHRPDAVHAPPEEASGLAVLAPGRTMALTMSLSVAD